jgi:hypothetical protein
LDAIILESSPVPVGVDGPQLQHGLGTRHFPTHSGTLHAILDHVTARPLDDSRGDGVAGAQVVIVTHAVQIVLQELAQPSQTFAMGASKTVFGSHLTVVRIGNRSFFGIRIVV